jgi:1-aminocyclopropane-1-carboxylate deaminase/D-cysteine desulfhydrase-like pyridoxal-dependent ACC family enzyme
VLRPFYSGKAMAGLFSAARSGRVDPDTTVVFLQTGAGGAPRLSVVSEPTSRRRGDSLARSDLSIP